jgi:DNA repair exonuclease SbcCD ATPase subunit
MEKWYQLGGKASIFWDPGQPKEENKTLLPGEVKQLKATERVTTAKRADGLVVLSEAEAQEYLQKNPPVKEAVKADNSAQSKLDRAAEMEQAAQETLKQAELKLEQIEDLEDELSELKTDKKNLIARVTELEADAAKQEKSKDKQRVKDLEAENEKLTDQVKTLGGEVSSLKAELEKLVPLPAPLDLPHLLKNN